ncbi:hypothetical protein ACKWTF_011791 [Chironomus riparius]
MKNVRFKIETYDKKNKMCLKPNNTTNKYANVGFLLYLDKRACLGKLIVANIKISLQDFHASSLRHLITNQSFELFVDELGEKIILPSSREDLIFIIYPV